MLPSGVRTRTAVQKTWVQTCPVTKRQMESDPVRRCEPRDSKKGVLSQKVLVALACGILTSTSVGDAQALLASPNTQIPRSAEAALRRSIPAFNDSVFELQRELESVQYKLRIPQRKPWQDMLVSATNVLQSLTKDESSILQGVLDGDENEARELLRGIQNDVERLVKAIEIKDPDRTSIRVANALERVGNLELLQTPGLRFPIPSRYDSLPRLTGRAVCEFTIKRQSGGEPFYVNEKAGSSKIVTLQVTVDGFSAPLTGGRFVQNVKDGRYNQQILRVDETSIFGSPSSTNADVEDTLPLELLARGDFEPTYRYALDINSGEVPVLPLSIYGSVAMTRAPSDGYSSPFEFFIFKYNRQQSGLSGFSFDEGQFGVFGYVTSNDDVLRQIEDGDLLMKATIVSGEDKLVIPRSGSSQGKIGQSDEASDYSD